VGIRIFYGLIALLIISTGTVFAQETFNVSLINVQTDDNNYDEGDIVVVSGSVTTIIGDTPVTLQLFVCTRWNLFIYNNCRRSTMEEDWGLCG